MTHSSGWTAPLLALVLSACDWREEASVVAEGPIHAEFRKDVGASIGEFASVTVHGTIAVSGGSLEADCWGPARELVEDATGARLAYRCDDDQSWRVVYVQGALFDHCRLRAGRGATPPWSSVPTFLQAAPSFLGCTRDPTELLYVVREVGGEGALADTLARGVSAHLEIGELGADSWVAAFTGLSDERKAQVARDGRSVLTRPKPGGPAIWHVLVATRGDGVETSVLGARAKELIAHFTSADSIPLAGLLRVLALRDGVMAA